MPVQERTVIENILIKSQQYLLSAEGYYDGPINGVWDEKCKDAIKAFAKTKDWGQAAFVDADYFKPFAILPTNYKWSIINASRAIVIDPKKVRVDFEEYISKLTESCKTGQFVGQRKARPSAITVPSNNQQSKNEPKQSSNNRESVNG